MAPDIYGNRIVWMGSSSVSPDVDGDNYFNIYMYDLSTNKKTQISNTGAAKAPAIYDNKIVWAGGNSGRYDIYDGNENIYMYDLSTKKETKITTSGSASNPAIYGNRIVWEDWRNYGSNGQHDIYMYDLSTKKETQITTNMLEQMSPDIYGNSILWDDGRSGWQDIYAYDLTTKQQIHTSNKLTRYNQQAPKIYNNKIVWLNVSGDEGEGDIILGTISYLPLAGFTAAPITGTHPLNVQFTDKSTDEYYYSWNFGDKSSLSTLENPGHKYANAGKYTVTLTVKNAAGSNAMTKSGYITVK